MSEALVSDYAPRSLSHPNNGYKFETWEARDELFDEALKRVAAGQTITKVCGDPAMPSVVTFFRWARQSDSHWNAFVAARESQAHVCAAKVLDEAFETQDAALGKLRVDALKWTAAKLAPKQYGESTQLRHADADGEKLDTQPLVTELLSLMGPGAGAALAAPGAQLVKAAPQRLERRASGSAAPKASDDVSDLV